MKWVEEIIEEARCKGACRLADGIKDEDEIVRLLFSPQGREFCERNCFPSLERWRGIDNASLLDKNIYIDSGRFELNISQVRDIALIGDTIATLYINGTDCGHNIIVGHGADVRIIAKDYAVFEVFRIGECKVETTLDETSIEL